MRLKEDDIILGGFFINRDRTKIRQVIGWTHSGKAIWRGFWTNSGKHYRGNACTLNEMALWASREATKEEISSLNIRGADEKELKHTLVAIKYYLSIASDELLSKEIERRTRDAVDSDEIPDL